MLHQPGKFATIIEVEKDTVEAVFFALKESEKNVFLEPSEEIFNRYALSEKETIIVKSIVSESPTQILNGVETVTIEKVLVDIYTDPVLFIAQQGSEMRYIFMEAFSKYTINESKMFRYANRKGKKEALNTFLRRIFAP